MSRDLTPKELRIMQKAMNMTDDVVDTLLIVNSDGSETDVYSDEDKAIHNKYKTISMFDGDLVKLCQYNGLFSSDEGCQLFQQLEDHFNGKEIEDKELLHILLDWYEGRLCPGYTMDGNNEEFAEYLKSKIVKNR